MSRKTLLGARTSLIMKSPYHVLNPTQSLFALDAYLRLRLCCFAWDITRDFHYRYLRLADFRMRFGGGRETTLPSFHTHTGKLSLHCRSWVLRTAMVKAARAFCSIIMFLWMASLWEILCQINPWRRLSSQNRLNLRWCSSSVWTCPNHIMLASGRSKLHAVWHDKNIHFWS